MKIAIDGNGYGNAQVAFEGANHRAATAYDDLTSRLRGLGAMAGSDSTSADFAAAYDEAAAGAVGALGDLVASFASVGRLSTASLAAHRAADEASTMRPTLGSVVAGPVVYEGSMPERGYVAVLPSTPPTCLGGDPPGLPHEVAWVLDQIEGFVWPSADTDRLHWAAATWRRTAEEVAVLTTYCDGAQRGLAHEMSPEIPLAVAATDDLRDAVDEVAARLSELGGACESYADQVEEHRQLVLDLVWAMLRDAEIVQGIGIVLGVVTAGITAAGAAAVNAARIAIEAPRILRVITALRELVSAGARTVRLTLEAVTWVRVRLRRFVEARVGARGAAYGHRSLGAGQRLRYEASPKHGPHQRGRSAPAPTNGREVLDFSVPLRPATTDRRVAVDPETGEYVVFDMTADGVFHGHVRPWKGLSQAMQNALRNAGLVDRKGGLLDE